MEMFLDESKINRLFQTIHDLDKRIALIESRLNLPTGQEVVLPDKTSQPSFSTNDALEFKIGQFWFAKIGIVVLAIGIVLALTFQYKNLPSFLPSVIGYFFVVCLFLFSRLLSHSFLFISRYLFGGGLLLFYFSTLRLHFFSPNPVLVNRTIITGLLLAVVLINLLISLRRKSVYLCGLTLTLGYITALVSENSMAIFIIITSLSVLAVYIKLKFQWKLILIYAIVLTFFTHFIWFLNNPFLSRKIQLVSTPEINLIFVLVYIFIFACGNLLKRGIYQEDNLNNSIAFLNSFGGFGLFTLLTLISFQAHLAVYHLFASILFICLSIAFWLKGKSKYATFFYAIIGYSALSIAIIAQFQKPALFIWLCWQSLLVISTAIWFRSKFIVLANFVIYLFIFIASLVTAGSSAAVSLSFGIVALLSARIMNWQKNRLELKTEYMRNAYLATAFFIFPFAFYHILPGGFVGLSWVGIAIFYYILSTILQNKKYRWMALFTLLLTVGYVVFIGTLKLEPVFRIISFLVLGLALLIISILYTRSRTKSIVKSNPE